MTKEELEKEAEEYAKETYCSKCWQKEADGEYACTGFDYCGRHKDFQKGAESREKRITELETELAITDNDREHNYYECLDLYKKVEELEKENAELKKVAEFQQSSNMSRHFENKKLKEVLAVGSTFNKALNSMNKSLEEERDKYRNMVFDKNDKLTKAKEIIKQYLFCYGQKELPSKLQIEAERFLNGEVEK